MAIDSYSLGTVVKIQDVVSPANPDSVTITIVDSVGTTKVDNAAMTEEDSTTFYYLFQSSVSDVEGRYYVTTKVIKGEYTGLSKTIFELRND
jgi:hypothetical protein